MITHIDLILAQYTQSNGGDVPEISLLGLLVAAVRHRSMGASRVPPPSLLDFPDTADDAVEPGGKRKIGGFCQEPLPALRYSGKGERRDTGVSLACSSAHREAFKSMVFHWPLKVLSATRLCCMPSGNGDTGHFFCGMIVPFCDLPDIGARWRAQRGCGGGGACAVGGQRSRR